MGHALLSQFRVSSPLRLRSDLHIVRKLWHMATGLIGLAIYTRAKLTTDTMATTLLIFAACAFFVEYLRIHNERMNQVIMLVMKPIMRESEKNSVSGMPFYALGVSLSLFFF